MLSNNICAFRDLSLASMTEWHLTDDVHNTVVIEDGGEGGSEGGNEGGEGGGEGGNGGQSEP